MNLSTPPRRTVLTFRGTPNQLLAFLRDLRLADVGLRYDGEYDWELTSSMSRHPAGKGLIPGG